MKRNWLQIHLSTAILLMFVAGVLMMQNVRIRKTRESSVYIIGGDEYQSFFVKGWPLPVLHSHVATRDETGETASAPENDKWDDSEVIYEWLIIDVIFALGILFIGWFACESWIWWRQKVRAVAAINGGNNVTSN